VKKSGSFVSNCRLEGHLAVTRSIGDFFLQGVMHQPEVTSVRITDDAYRLVIGCDGVFDMLENDEVGELVMEEKNVHRAATLVRNAARAAHSGDNISVVVVNLAKHVADLGKSPVSQKGTQKPKPKTPPKS
jgi:serine/threonine protein phosphatase PrpC